MDSETTIQSLKDRIKIFCEARDWDQYHNAKNLAIGVITEASELLEHFRFQSEPECDKMFKDPKKRQEIAGEMIDVVYFVLRLAQMYNIDLSEEFEKKMKGNEKKYPINLSKGSNKKYNELKK